MCVQILRRSPWQPDSREFSRQPIGILVNPATCQKNLPHTTREMNDGPAFGWSGSCTAGPPKVTIVRLPRQPTIEFRPVVARQASMRGIRVQIHLALQRTGRRQKLDKMHADRIPYDAGVVSVKDGAWFKKGSGTVVRSTRPTFGRCPAVPATVSDSFLNHAKDGGG